jgi:DNA gyrase/topoisomerase IV subunit B
MSDAARSIAPLEAFEFGRGFVTEPSVASIGLFVANTRSEWMEVTTRRNGEMFSVRTERGQLVRRTQSAAGPTAREGTSVLLELDRAIFSDGRD